MTKFNLHKNLSIIKKLTDTYKLWFSFIPHFPKTCRYTLGSKIDFLIVETIELIVQAVYSDKQNKIVLLNKASNKLELIKFFVSLMWDMGVLDSKKHIALSKELDEIGKMLGGWKKKLIKETSAL